MFLRYIFPSSPLGGRPRPPSRRQARNCGEVVWFRQRPDAQPPEAPLQGELAPKATEGSARSAAGRMIDHPAARRPDGRTPPSASRPPPLAGEARTFQSRYIPPPPVDTFASTVLVCTHGGIPVRASYVARLFSGIPVCGLALGYPYPRAWLHIWAPKDI